MYVWVRGRGCAGDLGAIDAKYDVAVSTAVGALDYIVVETTSDAQRCVEYLRKWVGRGVCECVPLLPFSSRACRHEVAGLACMYVRARVCYFFVIRCMCVYVGVGGGPAQVGGAGRGRVRVHARMRHMTVCDGHAVTLCDGQHLPCLGAKGPQAP